MLRRMYRSVVSFFCGHDWQTVHCIERRSFDGRWLPPVYVVCRKCGLRADGSGWDD